MNRTGEIVNGVEIIAYRSAVDIDVKFSDGTILTNVEYSNLKKNSIKNPFEPRICKVGFIGIGKYDYINNITAYRTWEGMIRRCYDDKHQKDCPTYKGCIVHPDWHNFQNFAKWFYGNYKDGFQLDKDLLELNNRVYSSDKCRFIPQDLNKIFTSVKKTNSITPLGVYPCNNRFRASINKGKNRVYLGSFDSETDAFSAYKNAKESYIKEQAEKYKNDIDEKIYHNLINYIVKP